MYCVVLSQLWPTLCDPVDCSPSGSSAHGGSPGQNTLPGDLPNPGIKPRSPICRPILSHLSHQGSPGILEWVAYPFSSGSSWPKNWTRVSCIGGGFFTSWAPREALTVLYPRLFIHKKSLGEGSWTAKHDFYQPLPLSFPSFWFS